MKKPVALLTNDDGIESNFLGAALAALTESFDVYVAAPVKEQSWIGRAVSRHNSVSVRSFDLPAAKQSWAIGGTPTDCVNIALGHLLPTRPDVVISGINIGFNVSINFILSSGTVAGAMEGANWGIPSIALSHQVPEAIFESVRSSQGVLPAKLDPSLQCAAKRGAAMALELVGRTTQSTEVINVNFPSPVDELTPVIKTRPGVVYLGSLFAPENGTTDQEGMYNFKYTGGKLLSENDDIDVKILKAGKISYSHLNFTQNHSHNCDIKLDS